MNQHGNDDITIIIEPSSGILRAEWARPLLTGALIDSYQLLLGAAEAYGRCRFWHLDLRRRIWPAATFMNWLSEAFAPEATQRLAGPVYIACWVAAKHLPHIEHLSTTEMQRRTKHTGFYPRFFTTEAEARAWLQECQKGLTNQQKPTNHQVRS